MNQNNKKFPHDNVYTRIASSKINGVGVFAVRDISTGTNIFNSGGEGSEIIWVDKNEIMNLDQGIKKLYDDFCVIKKDRLGCPKNFNALTVEWYLNESKNNPNVQCNDDYDFFAIRDIKKGEELLVDYSTYSQYPEE